MAKLLSNRLIQELDGNGAPYAGAKLFTYAAGTSTKTATYQDEASSTAHANPIVLDANGRIPAGVWLTLGQEYKLILAPSTDTDPPVSPIWTLDDITGINDLTVGGLDQWSASGLTPTFISASSFSVPGDVTSTFHVGRRLKITDAGGTKYATITATAFTTVTTVTVSVDASGSLSSPTSAVSYGVMTSANSSIPARRDTVPAFANNTDPSKMMGVNLANVPTATIITHTTGAGGFLPAGIILKYGGSSIPTGFLDCYGAAVSRTTYAALFTAIGTTWGSGDGATTFNLPNFRGKGAIGDGTGSITASGVDAGVDTTNDTLTVASNTHKWTTGMAVVFNLTSGTITGLLDDTTYYVIRASTTTIKLATTLANAQNGTAIDFTAKSSPIWDITHNLTARTLGEYLGEEGHAMSSTEHLLHTHVQNSHQHSINLDSTSATGGFVRARGVDGTGTTGTMNDNSATATNQNTGGNAVMNTMNPGGVVKFIISY